jgi:hypothetical protein
VTLPISRFSSFFSHKLLFVAVGLLCENLGRAVAVLGRSRSHERGVFTVPVPRSLVDYESVVSLLPLLLPIVV